MRGGIIRESRRKRGSASLLNSRYTKTIFFSKQLLSFLVLITLFRSSGDHPYKGRDNHLSVLVVSAAVATPAVNEKVEEKKRIPAKGVDAHTINHSPSTMNKYTRKLNNAAFVKAKEIQSNPNTSQNNMQNQMTFSEILKKAGKRGMGGGIPGAIAGVVQVITLMWLRTVMNYQCRYGANFPQALRILYNDGGIPRFYRGLSFALVQAPLARFVSTAANDGVESLLSHLELTEHWGPGRSTFIASIVVGCWRMALMPIDTCKTVLQVDSIEGFRNLWRKVKAGKIHVLYQGAFANAASSIAAHYPWFYTYRILSKSNLLKSIIGGNLLRNASIGFVSSVVSDTVSNAMRVIKTTKQAIASKHTVGYGEVVAMILAADGWKGLFGRGLRTRILGNAVQSVLFTVIWRGLAERWGSGSGPEAVGRNLREEKSGNEEDGDDVDDA